MSTSVARERYRGFVVLPAVAGDGELCACDEVELDSPSNRFPQHGCVKRNPNLGLRITARWGAATRLFLPRQVGA